MMASHMLLSDLYTTRSVRLFSETELIDEDHPGKKIKQVVEKTKELLENLHIDFFPGMSRARSGPGKNVAAGPEF